MTSVLPSHPLRLLFFSAIVGIGASCLMLFSIARWWNGQHAVQVPTPVAHTDGAWERERLKAIERSTKVLWPRAPEVPPPNADATVVRTLEALRRRIEERYNVEILMFDTRFLREEGIDASPYPLASLQEHLRNLNDWIRMYPPEYIKHSGLETIAIFKGWELDGVPTSGFLLDRSSIGIEATETVFHHELFHVADMNDGGMEHDNVDWLHEKYGKNIPQQLSSDGIEAIAQKLYEGPRPTGFMNPYGKYGGVDEDQAVVAEYLFSYPEEVSIWTKKDSTLLKSVVAMKMFFYAHSNGLMDATFWADLQKGVRLDDGYWETRRSKIEVPSSKLAMELKITSALYDARTKLAEGSRADAEAIFIEAHD